MSYTRPNLDDFAGTDDQKFAAAIATNITELQISRVAAITAPVPARNYLTIYGLGKMAYFSAAPVYVQQTGACDIFSGANLTGFGVRDLSMVGGVGSTGVASFGVNITNGDECFVERCLIKNCVLGGVQFLGDQAAHCWTGNNRVSAPSNVDASARGIGFFHIGTNPGGGNAMRSEYDYISGYPVGWESQAEAAKADQVTVEASDIAFRVSNADALITGGLVNSCRIAIAQVASPITGSIPYVFNDFLRNAYPSNCQIIDATRFQSNWNYA